MRSFVQLPVAMSTYTVALLLMILVTLAHGANNTEENHPPTKFYDHCLKILEDLCEGNGSSACTELVKLCGRLLKEHIAEAHQPEFKKCYESAAYMELLQRRHRTMENIRKAPSNKAMSVKLAQEWLQLGNQTDSPKSARSVEKPPSNPETSTVVAPTKPPPTGEDTRRDLRGMLPENQALTFPNPLEKRSRPKIVRPRPRPEYFVQEVSPEYAPSQVGFSQRPNSRPEFDYQPTRPITGEPDYMASVRDYRMYFLETKGELILEWLVDNTAAFGEFLKYWKSVFPASVRASRSATRG